MMVLLATFPFPHQAHIAKGKLAAQGIDSLVADEHTINAFSAIGEVRLLVDDLVVEKAAAVLASDHSDLLT